MYSGLKIGKALNLNLFVKGSDVRLPAVSLDLWHLTYWGLTERIMMSAALGGLIGLEREWSNHSAGFRTHILVCMGSTLIMLLSIYGFSEFINELNVRVDPARLAAQVISGIGFLGAGAILRNGSTVSGLTTAASIWVVAAIGLCVGAGFYYSAVLATLLVVFCLFMLNKVEKWMIGTQKNQEVQVSLMNGFAGLEQVIAGLEQHEVQMINIRFISFDPLEVKNSEYKVKTFYVNIKVKKKQNLIHALEFISSIPGVVSVEVNQILSSAGGKKMEQ